MLAKTTSILERFEIKYLLSAEQYLLIKKYLQELMELDIHSQQGGYWITSLYFDSPNWQYYYDKLAGLEERRKVRLRFYQHSLQRIFWEIKEKNNDYIVKRRQPWQKTLSAAPMIANWRDWDYPDFLLGEFARQSLEPKLLIGYWREAYVAKGLWNVRVSFDHQVWAAEARDWWQSWPQSGRLVSLQSVDHDKRVIMEFKFSVFLPRWLAILPQIYSLPRLAISKYALAVETLMSL